METTIRWTLLIVFVAAPVQASLLVGRVDDFSEGRVGEWQGGPTHSIALGGPAGPDDPYLKLDQTNYPFHIGTSNSTTWAGDYRADGITGIGLDVYLDSTVDLSLRLVLFGPGGQFITTTAVEVQSDGNWHHVELGLTPADLTHLIGSTTPKAPDGPGILTDTLSHVTTLLIRHDPFMTPPGRHPQHILGIMGLDNITALTGPRPSYHASLTLGGVEDTAYFMETLEPLSSTVVSTEELNPTLHLHVGERYQINTDLDYPFELVAQGTSADQDTVLLSTADGIHPEWEYDPDVAWQDTHLGSARFTLTETLAQAMVISESKPGYRCVLFPDSMRGDITICTGPPQGDVNGDCRVDFEDLAILTSQWLDENEL